MMVVDKGPGITFPVLIHLMCSIIGFWAILWTPHSPMGLLVSRSLQSYLKCAQNVGECTWFCTPHLPIASSI